MTQSLTGLRLHYVTRFVTRRAAGLFAVAGALQMTQWAIGKHKRYRKEFPTYPRRKAIIPFVI